MQLVFDIPETIGVMWKAVGVIWLVGMLVRRPSVVQESPRTWILHGCLGLVGFSLLGSDWLRVGWLGARFAADSVGVQSVGFTLTFCGCLIAIWSRVTLGGNWSGRVALQKHHELVMEGPYGMARHPMYLGFLMALAGTVVVIGEVRGLVGFAVIVSALGLKMRLEERLMMRAFPEEYPAYRKRVKALIPGVL